jgi:hypothetical protein
VITKFCVSHRAINFFFYRGTGIEINMTILIVNLDILTKVAS